MFADFLRFDLRYHLRSPLIWVAGFVFGMLAFGATTSDAIQLGGAIGNVHRNAPVVVVSFFSVLSVMGLFVVTAFIAQPLLRDFEMRTDELFFATPMRTRNYLAGRIAAGLLASLVIYLFVSAGIFLGALRPGIDPVRLGPFSLLPHAWAFAVLVIPNLIFMSALLGLLAVTTRRLLTVYLGVMGFFVLFLAAGFFTRDIRYDWLATLLDPFGTRPLDIAIRYWSASERNTQLPPFAGYMLVNRALWLGISAVLLWLTFRLFRPQRLGSSKRAKRAAVPEVGAEQPTLVRVPAVAPRFDASVTRSQFFHELLFEAKYVLKSVPFLVLLCFGMVNLFASSFVIEDFYGTKVLPTTAMMLLVIQGSYSFLLVFIVAFYAGELIWRERSTRLSDVIDALPVPNWVPLLAKTAALALVIVAFMLAGVLLCVAIQLARGYTSIEGSLYLSDVLIQSCPFILWAVAAIVLQTISNNKFIGYFLFIVLFIVGIVLPAVHLEHHLYNFASAPNVQYSDMNGYGHFLKGWSWFQLYWAEIAAGLLVIAAVFWRRGVTPTWRERCASALGKLHGKSLALLILFFGAALATGAWIYYNTNVVNTYMASDDALDVQAHYEKAYRHLKDVPQPRVTDVKADVDIFPKERRAVVHGHYTLVNPHSVPIDELHLFMEPHAQLREARMEGASLQQTDDSVGYRRYRLSSPLQPGAVMHLDFVVERAERGFTNSGMAPAEGGILPSTLNYNGTFFNNMEMMPHFGYSEDRQIVDRSERRKRGLGDVPRMPKLEDEAARNSIGFADGDFVTFETTVSTSADQVALAPGYLVREWTANGRRYFHYKMDRPILNYFCYLSGKWSVKRGMWRGLPIEVYFDPKHAYNVDRMIDSAQKSLEYFSNHFSPYQFHQLRILEFPGYAKFAESFANTIPFSEAIGFVADLRDRKDLDYVFYVTAHEVAHQWWAHQVIGGHMQGQEMLIESMAQYSALMVMEKEYGRAQMRKFLKYELDRYLRGRGGELLEEQPLMRVENQPYIHYQKGSLVFYRLRDAIGEDTLNRALAKFLKQHAFEHAPFTTSRELVAAIRAEAPPDKQRLIDELFEKIVFYDVKVTSATAKHRPDGKYEVELAYSAEKHAADGLGKESPMPIDDWMDVGVFDRKPGEPEEKATVLYLEKRHIDTNTGTIKLVVDRKPYEVGVDPYNKLIDRIPDDNRKEVSVE